MNYIKSDIPSQFIIVIRVWHPLMYIVTSSLNELESRLEITAGEAKRHGCTWSISKFFVGRNVNIVSGH